MTTPAEQAERAKVDRWIADWNAKQILAYNEQVKRRNEQYKKCEERERGKDDGFTSSEHMKEWEAKYDFGEHIRRRFPVGTFFDSIEEDYDGDRRSSSAQLMRVAETGMQLFYAAIGHIDATEEFLEEARSRWGPLVDAALQEMNESIERRDPVTGEFTVHVWPPGRTARRTWSDDPEGRSVPPFLLAALPVEVSQSGRTEPHFVDGPHALADAKAFQWHSLTREIA